MPEYQHKSVQRLAELYEGYKDEIGKGAGFMGLMWKALSPSIPEILIALDQDEELLQKIYRFLDTIVTALKEDIGEK